MNSTIETTYVLESRLKRGACLAFELWSELTENENLQCLEEALKERKDLDKQENHTNTEYRLIKKTIIKKIIT